jgi:AcrR family transcriptional regulator
MSRPLRADAARNRERLLKVAVRAFSESGPGVTLESIARDAGFGIGTLYRHFPTRESLIEAAYRNELAELCDAADDLLHDLEPDQALRTWMDRLIDYMTMKRGMADALRVVIASGGQPFAQSRDLLTGALAKLSSAAGFEPEAGDLLASLSGVSLVAGQPDQREQAGRMLDLLMDGLRYRASA